MNPEKKKTLFPYIYHASNYKTLSKIPREMLWIKIPTVMEIQHNFCSNHCVCDLQNSQTTCWQLAGIELIKF